MVVVVFSVVVAVASVVDSGVYSPFCMTHCISSKQRVKLFPPSSTVQHTCGKNQSVQSRKPSVVVAHAQLSLGGGVVGTAAAVRRCCAANPTNNNSSTGQSHRSRRRGVRAAGDIIDASPFLETAGEWECINVQCPYSSSSSSSVWPPVLFSETKIIPLLRHLLAAPDVQQATFIGESNQARRACVASSSAGSPTRQGRSRIASTPLGKQQPVVRRISL